TMGEKIDGLKEEMKGKLKHDQHLIQEGHDKRTGELKRHQIEEDNNPKAFANAKPDDSGSPANASEGQQSQRQDSGVNHENVHAEQRKADEEARDRNDRDVQERVESQVNAGDRAEMLQ
ncbi:hypothetical protein FRC00_009807, partial [Tulasnella sp. 408]